jgi:ABC-type Zn uptake system ZnuABC Zn-binding protein ZnuA
MKTITILLLASGILACQDLPKKKVLCTLPVLQSIVQELGGDAFEASSLSEPYRDPHRVDPTPTLMKRVREADLLVEVGMSLELWADEVANGSGNLKVQRGGKGRVTASSGIPREEIPAVLSRSEGDVHPEGNPHLWLDPLRAKMIADNVAAALKAAAPDKAASIDERLKKFKDRVDEALFGAGLVKEAGGRSLSRKALDGALHAWLDEKKLADKAGGWLKKAAPLRGKKVVEFHKTWIYFAKLFGMEIVGSVEPKPGIKPGPRHLADLSQTIRSQGVRAVIAENYQDPSNARHVAGQGGAKVAIVPTQVGGEPGTDDYFKFIDYILDRLLEAAK